MPFFGKRSDRFGEEFYGINKYCQFPSSCSEHRSFSTNNITGIKASIDFVGFRPEFISADVNLDFAFTVLQMCEAAFSVVTLRHNSACNPNFLRFVGGFFDIGEILVNRGSCVCRLVFMWIRLYAEFSNFVQLLATLLN